MRRAWKNFTAYLRIRTRYTGALEAEIARLRAENRALVNSILGVAGIPPMRAACREVVGSDFSPDLASEMRNERKPGGPSTPNAESLRSGAPYEGRPYNVSGSAEREPSPAVPLRRRSWQQIGRALEIEDARAAQREREADVGAFPPPRRIVPRL
ncbi:MAG TPA: hypothetical protein VKB26_12585 [Candidatus Acidoferrales bacterium]|nr:hypothetical protein [Candidatus Acidoferrales bacterium]